MKPFADYDRRINATLTRYNFPYSEEEKKLLKIIAEEKLTHSERIEKELVVREMWEARYKKADQERIDNWVAAWEEFRQDCRAELRYDRFLTPEGIEEIENAAIQKATDEHYDFEGTEKCFDALKRWIKNAN